MISAPTAEPPARGSGGAGAPRGPHRHKAVFAAEPRALPLYIWEMCLSLGERSVSAAFRVDGGGLFSPGVADARPIAK